MRFEAPAALKRSPVLLMEDEFIGVPIDCEFVRMQYVYGPTGGLAKGDDLARWLEDLRPGAFANLTRLMLGGEIFAFRWRQEYWVPLFQLDPVDFTVKRACRRVLAELAGVFDGWTLATWFAEKNFWLNNKRPVELLDSHVAAVLGAARADRFIAVGSLQR